LCAPPEAALRKVQADHDLTDYRATLERWWGGMESEFRALDQPRDIDPGKVVLRDGDTLFCACAAPDSPRRKHPCHVEILAPYLVRAGWDAVIWGRRLTLRIERATTTREGVVVRPERRTVVWAGTPERFDPAAYGWPNTETTT